jgi:hypothetical protein
MRATGTTAHRNSAVGGKLGRVRWLTFRIAKSSNEWTCAEVLRSRGRPTEQPENCESAGYLASILPGLADLPIQRVSQYTPAPPGLLPDPDSFSAVNHVLGQTHTIETRPVVVSTLSSSTLKGSFAASTALRARSSSAGLRRAFAGILSAGLLPAHPRRGKDRAHLQRAAVHGYGVRSRAIGQLEFCSGSGRRPSGSPSCPSPRGSFRSVAR